MSSTNSPEPVTIRGGRPEDWEQILAVTRTAWPDASETIHQNDPEFAWDQFRILQLGSQVVSSLKVLRREIVWGSSTVRMGGIGDVVTHPAYRGKGYASLILGDAVQYMIATGYEASILFTGLHAFYGRSGWSVVPQPQFTVRLNSIDAADAGQYAARPFDREADLEAVAQIHSAHTRSCSGAVVRSRAYWQHQFAWCGEDPAAFTVVINSDRIVGYLRAAYREQRISVEECAYHDGHQRSVEPLAARVVSQALDRGQNELTLNVPADNDIVAAMRKFGLHVTAGRRDSLMLQPLNLASLGRKLSLAPFTSTTECLDNLPSLFFWMLDGF